MHESIKIDPKLDLVLEKTSVLTVEQIWKGLTHPETLMKWFCPRPWKVTQCRIELCPGGEFYNLMEGPQGEKMPGDGCILEVIENKKLVWTNMMSNGYRPNRIQNPGFAFVATILITKTNNGSLYKAIVAHGDEESRIKHEKMGFHEGWSIAFNQLVELMK